MDMEMVKRVTVPVLSYGVGLVLTRDKRTATVGRLLCFFGAQTGMTLYMKQILSHAEVSEGRAGVPAAFAITGLQQLVGFVILLLWIPISSLTAQRYTPRQLKNPAEFLMVCLFSFIFMMNIAMNNYSISLMPISVNLIIRSCFPVPTFVAQTLVDLATKSGGNGQSDARPLEVFLMLLGVAFAVVAVVAKFKSPDMEDSEAKHLTLGVMVCVASCFAGSLSLVLVGIMGSSLKLNEFDTIVYTALPAAVMLLIPMSVPHEVDWQEGALTDWEVLRQVLEYSPSTLCLAALSGVFALALNLAKYSVVQSLSATHTAFAGNFNKAFTILLAMILGFEAWPREIWGVVMVLACMGNIGAFTGYNVASIWRRSSSALEEEEEAKKHLNGGAAAPPGDLEEDTAADSESGNE